MSWMTTKALREKIDGGLKKSRAIIDARKTEDRELSPEDKTAIEAIYAEVNKARQDLELLLGQEQQEEDTPPPEENSRMIGRTAEKIVAVKDLRGYSLHRAINKMLRNEPIDGLEREVSDELAKKYGKSPQGFYMPINLPVQKRDLSLSTGAGAKSGTQVDASNFIEYLYNKMLVAQLGARFFDGLTGDFALPRQSVKSTAYWVTEGNAPSESQANINQVLFAPSTVGAYTEVTRKFLLQSAVSAENFTREELARTLAMELDRIAFNGSGSGAEPEGILQNSSCPTVALGTNGAAPTPSKMIELESVVSNSNADVGSLAYVTSAHGRGTMKGVAVDSGSGKFIWQDGEVNDYPAYATNNMPHALTKASGSGLSAVIFGDWSSVAYAFWSAVDILVDPYSLGTSGGVRIVALQDCDMQLRHPESFAKIVDLFTAESTLST